MTAFPISLDEVNAMDTATFVAVFGDVAEHSPWVAERASTVRPFASKRAMIEAFGEEVREAGPEQKIALLRSHPDLAGKAAIAGELAAESKREQAGAGLDQLTADEFTRFTDMNATYRDRFGFPFILAVKGATKDKILDSFAERVTRDPEAEFAMAIGEVVKIISFRIDERISP